MQISKLGDVLIPALQYDYILGHKDYEIRVTSRALQLDEVFESVGNLEGYFLNQLVPSDLKVVIFYSADQGKTYDYHHGVRLL